MVRSKASTDAVRPSSVTPPAMTILPLWIAVPNIERATFIGARSLQSPFLGLYTNSLLVHFLGRKKKTCIHSKELLACSKRDLVEVDCVGLVSHLSPQHEILSCIYLGIFACLQSTNHIHRTNTFNEGPHSYVLLMRLQCK